MKLLILAPHPFYQERGTPIAVDLLLRSLGELGHESHLLTFPEGDDVAHPGLTIHRLRAPRVFSNIRPGFSLKKLCLDLLMARAAARLVRGLNPDVIYAFEEAVLIARVLQLTRHTPYVYDMDSSIPDQLTEKYAWLRPLRGVLHACLGVGARRAGLVVPVCDALAEVARRYYRPRRIIMLYDISLLDGQEPPPPLGIKAQFDVRGCCFMYIGNLEHYQGIDLLIDAFALHHARKPEDRLILVGGPAALVSLHRKRAEALGLGGSAHFLGPRPTSQMAALFREADVLVSPRTKGTNTPMKIYSYLDSGRAVLATRLKTHTQVMDDTVSLLAEPTPEAFAEAMGRLSGDPLLRQRLADAARALVAERYSHASHRAAVGSICRFVQEELL